MGRVCVHVCARVQARVYGCKHAMHVHESVHVCTCMYTCAHVHLTCVCMYAYVCDQGHSH